MFIPDYALPQDLARQVVVSDSLSSLFAADEERAPNDKPALLVWRGAFHKPKFVAQFEDAKWPIDLIRGYAAR